MRLSRKAGLLASGALWDKYECSTTSVFDGYAYGQYPWRTIESGVDPNVYFQGSSIYPSIEWSDYYDRYVYVMPNDQSFVSPANPGSVYELIDPETVEMNTVDRLGNYTRQHRELTTVPIYRTEYSVGQIIGTVRAAKDAYPDAENGYAYVGMSGIYVIMRDTNGEYFAYTQA